MLIPFWKMQGAGNDFVLVDARSGCFVSSAPARASELCARRTGIGADGLILILSSMAGDFALRFFNPDGTEAGMCGNGTRCAARLACELGEAHRKMTIETSSGILKAEVAGDEVRLLMGSPSDWRPSRSLKIGGESFQCCFINTGVPHVVIEVADVKDVDVDGLGSVIRHHDMFAPEGANVDFISVRSSCVLNMRTYERGVESETLACGTGAVACGLVAGRDGIAKPPVDIICASGDKLVIDYRLTDAGADDVSLLGPAKHVFHGSFEQDTFLS